MEPKEATITLKLPHHNSRNGGNLKAWHNTQKPKCIAASSGEYVRTKKPKVYARVVRMLSSPEYSFKDISTETHLSWSTIRAIYEREAPTIQKQREVLTKKVGRTLRHLVEHCEDIVPEMTPRDAIFGVSVFSNQFHLLTGAATSHNVNLNIAAKPVDIAGQFAKLHAQIDAVVDAKTNLSNTDLPSDSPA